MDSQHIYTVSELNATIRSMLEARFPFITVAGEISNLRRPGSGHYYFTLKDSQAQIRAVLFRMQARYLKEPLVDGKQVLCRGRLGVYAPRGEYQLLVDAVTQHGTGQLQLAFEELKQRLAEEGLFDEHLKTPPPVMPRHITLVTSPTGAAVRDFIKIARTRLPAIRLAVYPVAVQGETASQEMIQAIIDINGLLATDVIVLCRGGGSIEDLWAYNDERLARAIRSSTIPVVSGVGHEVDYTIADLAADLRAPTPSGAAEMLVPDGRELSRTVQAMHLRLERAMAGRLRELTTQITLLRSRLSLTASPLEPLLLRLDHRQVRLQQAMLATLTQRRSQLDRLILRLEQNQPLTRLHLHEQRLKHHARRLIQAQHHLLKQRRDSLARASGVLEAVSPLATLARGYAIVRKTNPEKTIVRAAHQVAAGEQLTIILSEGSLSCSVDGIHDKQQRR